MDNRIAKRTEHEVVLFGLADFVRQSWGCAIHRHAALLAWHFDHVDAANNRSRIPPFALCVTEVAIEDLDSAIVNFAVD